MTYNFDPERWYENALAALHSEFESGKITRQEYEKAEKELDRKLADMWKRLDGSYQI